MRGHGGLGAAAGRGVCAGAGLLLRRGSRRRVVVARGGGRKGEGRSEASGEQGRAGAALTCEKRRRAGICITGLGWKKAM